MFGMRRREFITLLGGAAASWPLAARAQQVAKPARIGFLGVDTQSGIASRLERFRAGLRELGYVEGENILLDFRWAEGNYARLAEFATELVRLKVDLLVTYGTPGTLAALQMALLSSSGASWRPPVRGRKRCRLHGGLAPVLHAAVGTSRGRPRRLDHRPHSRASRRGAIENLEINPWVTGLWFTLVHVRDAVLRPGLGQPVRARRWPAENAAGCMVGSALVQPTQLVPALNVAGIAAQALPTHHRGKRLARSRPMKITRPRRMTA
jgi:hypothetical protein